MTRTAVLIDGDFFLKRARRLWGDASPEKRASECHAYALRHIFAKRKMALEYGDRSLYRIFCIGTVPRDGPLHNPRASRLPKNLQDANRDEPATQ